MQDYYAIEAKQELEKRKERAMTLASAWRAIERYKTKDGKDFKNLAQNFTKGVITADAYSPKEKKISVYAKSDNGRYFDDYMSISPTVYNNSEEAKRYEQEGRLIERGAYLHPYINLTPDEIEKLVNDRADYYMNEVAELDKVLANFEEVANTIVEMRKQAEAYIQQQPDTAYYVLRKILREER